MKTQINTLIHGSNTIAGTNSNVRNSIAEKVIAENHNGMKVRMPDNVIIDMTAHWSESSKSVHYTGSVTDEQTVGYICVMNGWDYAEQTILAMRDGKAIATLLINDDMTCEMFIHHRRNENCTWKLSKTLRVEERDIEIL